MSSRRDFIKVAAFATTSLVVGGKSEASLIEEPPIQKASKPLKILILGGTGFIGPHQVRYALARGHKVTLFNRGKTNPKLFPDVEQLTGNRNGDLESLKGKEWDVVIDNPATLPRWVRDTAQLLKNSAKHYVFISTISVYSDVSKPDMDETAAVATIDDPTVEKITGETYGALKALAEKEAEKAFPGKALIIRPGLIVGPGDLTDRFSYWPVRIEKGGEILSPGTPDDPVQFIDARDLSEWVIRMVEQSEVGVYNATGPKSPLSIAEMLYGIKAVTTSDAKFTWVDSDFLSSQKVFPWVHMPVWVPPKGDSAGFSRISVKRAVAKGLTYRPLADTAKATLDWYKTRPSEQQVKLAAGISPERETEVLAAWHNRKKAQTSGV